MPPVPVEASAIARSAMRGDAVAIDVLHREDVDARARMRAFSSVVEIPDAERARCVRAAPTATSRSPHSSRRLAAEQRRQRHAVHVSASRRRRRIHVAVRVHPDQAERAARVSRTQSALAATEPAARL